ncbi:MAG TPA: MFS transporter [Saprospiraceae bacterium]|nr:MFS transporter [Saprospiraceae bacterium]
MFASIAMAFAGIGDALLYPVLPVYAEALGLSSLWVGILLSINRFIRIPGNFLIAILVAKIGNKKTIIIALFIATLTTSCYGLGLGIVLFLVARILWGLSYSALRISSLSYAAKATLRQNLLFGMNASIKTLGAVVALILGTYLIKITNIQISFLMLGAISFVGLFFAYQLPNTKNTFSNSKKILPTKISLTGIILFLTSFSIDGVLVVVISKILFENNLDQAQIVLVVGAYLLFRKLCSALIPIPIGLLADRISLVPIFKISLVASIFSLVLVGTSFSQLGIVGAFLFNSIIVSMSPAVALKENKNNTLTVLAAITTWWDLGAASGTLLGLILLQYLSQSILFFGLAMILTISTIYFFRKSASF